MVLVISCFPSTVPGAEKKAIIQEGVSQANLRAGPGVSHPTKTILNENDQLLIEGKEGEWYSVATVDGQKGYVHQSLVRVIGEERVPATREDVIAAPPAGKEAKPALPSAPPTVPLKVPKAPPAVDVPEAAPKAEIAPKDVKPTPLIAKPATSRPPSVAGAQDTRTVEAKSPALIHLLEGREGDMLLWLAIAVAFFFIGWICGGNYYLRRDRSRRTKLRF